MDYDLSRLGARQFEHLTQSLFQHFIGAGSNVFGDGPDGGREASWDGKVGNGSRLPQDWDGYGVLQAKFRNRPGPTPKDNANWLTAQLCAELDGWAKTNSNRKKIPDYFLGVTNVVLSPGVGGGIESVQEALDAKIKSLGLDIKGARVWHYDQLRTLLDDAPQIRTTYLAWICGGDVLQSLLNMADSMKKNLGNGLGVYAAKMLLDDTVLNLTQAGSVGDSPVRISDVFIDLPCDDGINNESPEGGIAAKIVAAANIGAAQSDLGRSAGEIPLDRVVLIGGPGQGKSTIGQFLCQVYRANFLKGQSSGRDPEVAEVIARTDAHATSIGLPAVSARRWPMKVKLTDLADSLAAGESSSLLQYISRHVTNRSGFDIDVASLRTWLTDYPWFLILDGLDEVPASSNRDDLLRVIKDFFVDARSAQADVFVMATTRPQGYNDDFDPQRYLHQTLLPLTRETALSYARQLLALKLGRESDRFKRTVSRLTRAADEEATARLMTSPLQVTILALLVERQGQVPNDRWRLFSHYYRVIYQREQEKGGELSDLLNEYESDINAVHHMAGYELQLKAERAGDTESLLSSAELSGLIITRLRAQGHDLASASLLAARFVTLSTERLVFLAALRQGTIGFEIRSLQEFMAGEFVLELPANDLPEGLRAIALSSHWRNVFLFAVGKIFAERQMFRGDVVSVCNLLNVASPVFESALPGSRLALSILTQGLTRTQPTYRKLLAACALQMLSGAPVSDLEDLAELRGFDAGDQLDGAIQAAVAGGTASRLGAARVLAVLANEGECSALERLTELVTDCSDTQLGKMTEFAWSTENRQIMRVLEPFLRRQGPGNLIALRGPSTMGGWEMVLYRRRRGGRGAKAAALPAWPEALLEILGETRETTSHSPGFLTVELIELGAALLK